MLSGGKKNAVYGSMSEASRRTVLRHRSKSRHGELVEPSPQQIRRILRLRPVGSAQDDAIGNELPLLPRRLRKGAGKRKAQTKAHGSLPCAFRLCSAPAGRRGKIFCQFPKKTCFHNSKQLDGTFLTPYNKEAIGFKAVFPRFPPADCQSILQHFQSARRRL